MSEDGREQILHILKPGTFCRGNLFDQGSYPATAEAGKYNLLALRNAHGKLLHHIRSWR